jgi:seryl-tRNA synthetase
VNVKLTRATVQADKGGNPELVRESQRKRGASVELVDEVIAIFAEHKHGKSSFLSPLSLRLIVAFLVTYEKEGIQRELNLLQKEIGTIKKAKGDASAQLAKKAELDKTIAEMVGMVAELGKKRDERAGMIGNIVDKDCKVSLTEVSPASFRHLRR